MLNYARTSSHCFQGEKNMSHIKEPKKLKAPIPSPSPTSSGSDGGMEDPDDKISYVPGYVAPRPEDLLSDSWGSDSDTDSESDSESTSGADSQSTSETSSETTEACTEAFTEIDGQPGVGQMGGGRADGRGAHGRFPDGRKRERE